MFTFIFIFYVFGFASQTGDMRNRYGCFNKEYELYFNEVNAMHSPLLLLCCTLCTCHIARYVYNCFHRIFCAIKNLSWLFSSKRSCLFKAEKISKKITWGRAQGGTATLLAKHVLCVLACSFFTLLSSLCACVCICGLQKLYFIYVFFSRSLLILCQHFACSRAR